MNKKALLLVMLCTVSMGLQAGLSYIAHGNTTKLAGYAQDFAVLNTILASSARWGIKLEQSVRGPIQIKPDIAQAEEFFTSKNIKKFAAEYQVAQPSVASSPHPVFQPDSAFMMQPNAMSDTALQRIATTGKDIVDVESALLCQSFMSNVIQSLPQESLPLKSSSLPVMSRQVLIKKAPKNVMCIKFYGGSDLWKIDQKFVTNSYAQKIVAPELYARKKIEPLLFALPEIASTSAVLSPTQLNNFINFATFKQLAQLQAVDAGVEILPPYEGKKATRLLDDIVTTEIFLPEEKVFYSGNILATMDDTVDMAHFVSLDNFYVSLLEDFSLDQKSTRLVSLFFRENSELLSNYAIDCVATLQKTKDVHLEHIFEKGLMDDFSDITYPSLDKIPFIFQSKTTPTFQRACRLIVKKYVTGLVQTVTASLLNQVVEQLSAASSSGDQSGEQGERVLSSSQFFEAFKNTVLFLFFLDYSAEHEEDDTDAKEIKSRQELFNAHKILALFWLMIQNGDFSEPLTDLFKKFFDEINPFIEKIMSEVKNMNQVHRAKLQYITSLIKKYKENKMLSSFYSLTPPVNFPNVYSFKIKNVEFGSDLSVILSQIFSENRNLLSVEMSNALFTPPLRYQGLDGFTGLNSEQQLYLVASLQWRQYLQEQATAKAKRNVQNKLDEDRKKFAEEFKNSGKQILRDQEANFATIMQEVKKGVLTKQQAVKAIELAEEKAKQNSAATIVAALAEQSPKRAQVINVNAPIVDLSMQQRLAKHFMSKSIFVVGMKQLQELSIKMDPKIMVTVDLLGAVQVCVWDLMELQHAVDRKNVDRIIDIVSLTASIK